MRLLLSLMVAVGLFEAANSFGVTARELLTLPSPAQRMWGARILQGSYVPPPRTNGEKLVARLTLGMRESAVAGLLGSAGATNESTETVKSEVVKTYRVDDLWVVRCSFTNAVAGKSEGGLSEARLVEQMNQAYVDPPADFTGVWVTYWMNGQVSYERHYQNGLLEGVNTGFYPNGAKSIVISYHNGVPDGEDTGFYPSGTIQYKGQYRAGKEVGHWIWYGENGAIETERDYDAKGK